MLRFLLLSLTLCFGFALAAAAAVAVGRSQSPSEAIRWFRLGDCALPCLLGVTVGKTSDDEARLLVVDIAPLPGTVVETGTAGGHIDLSLARSPQEALVVTFDSKDDTVNFGRVSFRGNYLDYFRGHPLTLADLISVYGIPSCAFNVSQNGIHSPLLYFDRRAYRVEVLVDYPIEPGSAIKLLVFGMLDVNQQSWCDRQLPSARWHGITARYPLLD